MAALEVDLEAAVLSAADPIENEAKRRARVKTGNMRRSIMRAIVRRAGPSAITGRDQRVTVAIGPERSVTYAKFIEWGTRRMRAFPFMRPAFDNKQREAMNMLRERWALIVRRAASSLPKAR